ncbi:MAG: SirB1 family protein [Isosphaeraceae bacterium]
MRKPFAESPEFRRLIEGATDVDLVRINLEIARDVEPGLDPEPYLALLDAFARRVRERLPSSRQPRRLAEQVNWVFFVEEGFQGDVETYDDPRNSYVNEVIDRKRGIPITLAILYQRVAMAAGLSMAGVNLPGHFMLRYGEGDETRFVDAFHAGGVMDLEGCSRRLSRVFGTSITLSEEQVAPCPPALVVARMLRNLKAIHAREGDLGAGLIVQRRLAAVTPDQPIEQRDLAMLALGLERPAEAIAPLQRYLKACPDAPDADDLRHVLRAVHREVARWN